MAIGDVRASGGVSLQLSNDRSGQIKAQSLSGLGKAFGDLAGATNNYAQSKLSLETYWDQRKRASDELSTDTELIKFQEMQANRFTEFARDYSQDPSGLTDAYDKQYEADSKQFLETVKQRDPRMAEEYQNKLERDRSARRGSMFLKQIELMDAADQFKLTDSLNTLASGVMAGTTNQVDAEAAWTEAVSKTSMAEQDKLNMIRQGRDAIATRQFSVELASTVAGLGAVNDGTAGDVAAANLTPQGRATLNAISAGESPGYNVWNGGTTFEGYADHPANLGAKTPGASSAAGKYQFIKGTWNEARKSYQETYGTRVPDFSPEWQDRVALHWAEKRFNQLNGQGLTFQGVIASGDPAKILQIKKVLGNPRLGNPLAVEWEGLGDKHMSDEKFLSIFMGEKGLAGGGTGNSEGPNIWSDERFAHISLEDKVRLASSAETARAAAVTSQREAESKAKKAYEDSMWELGYNSSSYNDLPTLLQDPNFDASARKRYEEGVQQGMQKVVTIEETSSKLTTGAPMMEKDSKNLDLWFGNENLRGIETGDEASYEKLRYMVDQGRYITPAIRDALINATKASDTRVSAFEFMAQLNKGDASVLQRSGFKEEDIVMADTFARIARTSSEQETERRFTDMQDRVRQLGINPNTARTEATKDWRDRLSIDKVIDKNFDNILPLNQPSITPAIKGHLEADAIQLYQDGYLMTGDLGMAEEYMNLKIKKLWGTSNIGEGNVMMRNPPTMNGYESFDSSDTLYTTIAVSIAEADIMDKTSKYQELEDDSVQLIADDLTEKEIAAGKIPTYRVTFYDNDGNFNVATQRWGGDSVKAKAAVLAEQNAESDKLFGELKQREEAARVSAEDYNSAILRGDDPMEVDQRRIAAENEAQELSTTREAYSSSSLMSSFWSSIRPGGSMSSLPGADYKSAPMTEDKASKMQADAQVKEFKEFDSKKPMLDKGFRKEVSSIIKGESKLDGSRYSQPEAEREAKRRWIKNRFGYSDEQAEAMMQAHEKGQL